MSGFDVLVLENRSQLTIVFSICINQRHCVFQVRFRKGRMNGFFVLVLENRNESRTTRDKF